MSTDKEPPSLLSFNRKLIVPAIVGAINRLAPSLSTSMLLIALIDRGNVRALST